MADDSTKSNSHLVRGRLLAGNVLWSVLGTGAPLLVAVPIVPILIRRMGTDRFGVLTLAWAVIGYASLFDLGLGRALTQVVAKKLGAGEDHEVPTLVWTSLLLMLILSAFGAMIVWAISPWLVHHIFKIPSALQAETLSSFYILALSLPVVITSAGLRGLLEAHQRFDLVTGLRIPIGVFTFAGPLLVLPFTRSLVAVIGVLVVGRLVTCAVNLLLCMRVVPELARCVAWHGPSASSSLRFGGWMTITNIVGPLMVTLDRFVIAALISVTAVAYYATPYELVTKLLLLPTALVGVMFPAFSVSYVKDKIHAAMLYARSVKFVFLALFPVVLLTIALASSGLTLWLGPDFARHSTRVVQWLALGVLTNSLALVPLSFIQGVGRPDLTAKLHLIELPFYLVGLFWLIRVDGIEGAAIAWSARTTLDAVMLFFMASHISGIRLPMSRKTTALLVAALLTLILAIPSVNLILRTTFLFVAILSFALGAWFLILTPEERSLAQRLMVIDR